MEYVGIDGCKAGWFAAALTENGVKPYLHNSFAEAWNYHKGAQSIFVDMPIGLPTSGARTADLEARRSLPPHLKSSIFNVPARQAVFVETKTEARSINHKLTGKSLSAQSLGLCAKIREVDDCMQRHPEARGAIRESHPEVCFCLLSPTMPRYAKKDLLGSLERLRIIGLFIDEAENFLAEARHRHPRSHVASDDMLDALVLAISAKECKETPLFFPADMNTPPEDETGLPMAIWHPEPAR